LKPISSIEELESFYGTPVAAALVKVSDVITPSYEKLIQASPFCVLSTVGPEGLDGSPRGDRPGFVRVVNERTLMLPDRMGNNRIDSLRNVVRDPRVALLFLIPGIGQTLRVNGRAFLTANKDTLASFTVEGKAPRTVMVVQVDQVYFQCARAIIRSELWNPTKHVAPSALPSAGDMLAETSQGKVGGPDYDAAWPARAKETMW
jgi:PPOX class probable FMN-dependent enzyme